MYIKIEQSYKCKKCGSTVEPEHVWHGDSSFKRCVICGHEALHSVLTTSGTGTGNYTYEYKDEPIEY